MKKSFLNYTTPYITEMIQAPTVEKAYEKINEALSAGATAIGLQLAFLDKKDRTKETLTKIFDACGNAPIYLTNYRSEKNAGSSDDELTSELLACVDYGATLIDIMGDTFDPAPEELTTNEEAIAKQIKLIEEIHKRGGEVLMSSHIKQYRSPERVLEVALEQQRRGVDVVKIVTGADTEEEERTNLEICAMLKRELKVPFLFLSGGSHSRLHRTIGPALGVCMWLCFNKYDETTYAGPPLLSEVLDVKKILQL